MRAEIVPLEMDVTIDQACSRAGDRTDARLMPALMPSGEEVRVCVQPTGGMAVAYGLDRKIPSMNDSAHDMITWAIGNVKLVFTTDEWATLVAQTDRVITTGRQTWDVVFGEEKSA